VVNQELIRIFIFLGVKRMKGLERDLGINFFLKISFGGILMAVKHKKYNYCVFNNSINYLERKMPHFYIS
jgi:hypothetical protein